MAATRAHGPTRIASVDSPKVYPNPHARATRAGRAALAGLLALLLVWAPAGAAFGLSVRDNEPPNYTAYGWTLLGLSLAAFAVGANGLSQRDDNLTKADAAYEDYQAAGTGAKAIDLRLETSKYHNAAKAWESTANLGLALGILFAASSYAAFSTDPNASRFMMISQHGVGMGWRF